MPIPMSPGVTYENDLQNWNFTKNPLLWSTLIWTNSKFPKFILLKIKWFTVNYGIATSKIMFRSIDRWNSLSFPVERLSLSFCCWSVDHCRYRKCNNRKTGKPVGISQKITAFCIAFLLSCFLVRKICDRCLHVSVGINNFPRQKIECEGNLARNWSCTHVNLM